MTATGFRPLRLAVLGGLGVLILAGCHTEPPQAAAAAHATGSDGFSWFTSRPAPAGWESTVLPDGTAVLSFPPTAGPVHADDGALAVAAVDAAGGYRLYVNATPQQGGESLKSWARFRIGHLTEDDASTATLDASAGALAFHGGTGSCVLDDYTSRIGAHRYREIACLVVGRHGGSVLVVASPVAGWAQQKTTIEQVVDSYAAN